MPTRKHQQILTSDTNETPRGRLTPQQVVLESRPRDWDENSITCVRRGRDKPTLLQPTLVLTKGDPAWAFSRGGWVFLGSRATEILRSGLRGAKLNDK